MKYSYLLMMALIGTLFLKCQKDTGNNNGALSIEDLLVKNNEITGWAYAGNGWIANNGSELTQHIDGGSELFIKYGFLEGTFQKYTGTIDKIECEIDIYIYNQTTIDNVSALFDDADLGLSGALTWNDNPAGIKAKYYRNSGLSQTMHFYRDKYLIELSISYDSEGSLNIIKQFAYNIDDKLKKAEK